jgi:hypothetical protein
VGDVVHVGQGRRDKPFFHGEMIADLRGVSQVSAGADSLL